MALVSKFSLYLLFKGSLLLCSTFQVVTFYGRCLFTVMLPCFCITIPCFSSTSILMLANETHATTFYSFRCCLILVLCPDSTARDSKRPFKYYLEPELPSPRRLFFSGLFLFLWFSHCIESLLTVLLCTFMSNHYFHLTYPSIFSRQLLEGALLLHGKELHSIVVHLQEKNCTERVWNVVEFVSSCVIFLWERESLVVLVQEQNQGESWEDYDMNSTCQLQGGSQSKIHRILPSCLLFCVKKWFS